jgi:transposase
VRGRTERQAAMLLSATPDAFIPPDHPIRRIRNLIDPILAGLSSELGALYADSGRRSVPPEHLIKATLLMALYSIRSERQFCERLRYDLLFKWFLDLNITDAAFDHSTFTKNRERLMDREIARSVLGEVVREARRRRLISEEHFTVDGTLLQAWASIKSLRPREEGEGPPKGGTRKGRNEEVDFHGERRGNLTHVSSTDGEARLARKSYAQAATLCYGEHLLMENRNGLIVDTLLTQATGYSEREAALAMLDRYPGWQGRCTLGADKGYDAKDFIEALRLRGVTPHVAQNQSGRRSAIDEQTAHHPGYAQSQRKRKRVEEGFGWQKTVGCSRKLRFIGVAKNQFWITFTAIAYNLVRMANLEPHPA